jgi:hypothetical protein
VAFEESFAEEFETVVFKSSEVELFATVVFESELEFKDSV